MICVYRGLRLTLVALLAYGLSFVLIGARVARAEMVSTETVLAGTDADADARDRVRALLSREDVAREFREHGISLDQARARVDALSDAELAQIAGRLNELPVGGSVAGAIVTALLIVFIILLITDIVGATDVFPFVKKPEERRQAASR